MIGLKQSERAMLSLHAAESPDAGPGVTLAQPLMAMHAKTISSNFLIALVLVRDR
jgi:hypothetical protein